MTEKPIKLPTSPEVELAYTDLLAYAAGPGADKDRKNSVRWRLDRLLLAQHQASSSGGTAK